VLIVRYYSQVLDRAHFLPQIGSTGEDTRVQYSHLCQALDEYMHRIFYEFTSLIPKVQLIRVLYVVLVVARFSRMCIGVVVRHGELVVGRLFLADRPIGRTFGTLCCLSVCRL